MAINRPLLPPRVSHPDAYRRAAKVSPLLQQEVGAVGVADAIVILEDTAAAGLDQSMLSADLVECFVTDERAPAWQAFRASRQNPSVRTRRREAGSSVLDVDVVAAAASSGAPPRVQAFDALNLLVGSVHPEGIARLSQDDRVRYVSSTIPFSLIRPDPTAAAAASAPARGTTTWGIDALNIPALWDARLDGQGVLIGHLDTGADGTHPALVSAIDHFLFVDMTGLPGPSGVAYDTQYHGTHTAATIAGRPVNGSHVGVAPGAKLAVATVIEEGQAARRVIAGLNWVVSKNVRIISMSLGFRGYHTDFYEIMRRIRERGVLPIVAAGNEGPGTSRSPGNYDLVLSVGASNASRAMWEKSSSQIFNRPVDPIVPNIVAPGVDVISAVPGMGWMSLNGTSMATPHIAGLAALLWQAKPTASVNDIESCIFQSATRGTMDPNRCGLGMPDAVEAYRRLTGQLPTPARSVLRRQGAKTATRKRAVQKAAARKAAVRKAAKLKKVTKKQSRKNAVGGRRR